MLPLSYNRLIQRTKSILQYFRNKEGTSSHFNVSLPRTERRYIIAL